MFHIHAFKDVTYRAVFFIGLLLFCQNAFCDDESTTPEGILFTNVVFKGDILQIDEIVLTNIVTHENSILRPYKSIFFHQGYNAKKADGFVFQSVPAGRYYVSELHRYIEDPRSYKSSQEALPKSIQIERSGSSINIMSGKINYIGDLVATVKISKRIELFVAGHLRAPVQYEQWCSLNMEFKPDIESVKSIINKNRSLFTENELVFNIPDIAPFLVDVESNQE